MNKKLKIVLGAGIFFLLLLIITAGLVILLFPAEKIKALIENEASTALNMPVTLDSIGLSFAGMPSVKATGLALGPLQPGDQPLCAIKAIYARIDIFDLLKKKITIVSMVIDKPKIMLLSREDGTNNLPPPTEKTKEKTPGPPTLPFPITMQSFAIKDCSVSLDNRKTGSLITVEDLSYLLSLDISEDLRQLQAKGALKAGNIKVTSGKDDKAPLIDGLEISFQHEVSGDLTTGNVSLSKGDLKIGGMPVLLTADIESWTKTSFNVSTGTQNAKDLLDLIPVALFPDKNKVSITGNYSFAAEGMIDTAPEQTAMTYNGKLDIDSMSITYEGMPGNIDEIQCRITFNEKDVTLNRISTLIGSSKFTLLGIIHGYSENPILALSTEGSIDLKEIGEALPQLSKNNLKGLVELKLDVNGPPSDPQAVKVNGNARLQNVEVQIPETLQHPAQLNGSLSITPSSMAVNNITLKSGKSDLTFKGIITNYPVLVWPKDEHYADFNGSLTSDLLDLTDMIIFPENSPMPKPWHMEQAIKTMPVPPNLSVDNSVKLGTVVFGKMKADSVTGRITAKDGTFKLHDLDIRAYKGALTGNAGMNIIQSGDATYDGSFKLNALDAGSFLSSFFGTGEDQFGGKLSSTLSFNGAGLDSVSMLENLKATGSLDINKGSISNWEFTKKLGQYLKFLNFDKIDFDRIRNSFIVENKKVVTPDMAITTSFGDINLDGTTGFDKSINYQFNLLLDETTSKKAAQQINSLTSLFKGETGRLELDLTAGGTLTSPSFSLDTSKAEDQLKARLKDSLKQEAEKLLDKQNDEVKQKGKELLKNIFKKD
ncbi:MAG: AsmA family protein [Candidatus Latescibacteria bacterium]|nr:AsmA family protein [Candidatus Latescibacterota bacterium]